MDVQDFREGITRYLREELGVREHGEPQSFSREKIQQAAQTVFRKIVEGVFSETERPEFMQKIQTAESDVQQRIFDACVGVQKEGIPEKVLIETALLCAQQNAERTAENFGNFGIQDRWAVIEIAKLCAQRDAYGAAKYFKNFKITDQEAIIEIAKLCALQNSWATAAYSGNFGITDPKVIIEVAKLCAQQGGGMAAFFGCFEIKDQRTIIEIAKICARQDVLATAAYFKNFGIEDQQVIIEIAKLCAQRDAQKMAPYFAKFGIQDQHVMEVAAYCLVHTPGAFKGGFRNIENVFGHIPARVLNELAAVYCRAHDVIQNPSSELIEAFSAQEGFEKALAVPDNKELLFSIICFCQAVGKTDALKSSAMQKSITALLRFEDPRAKAFVRDSLLDMISGGRIGDLERFFEGKVPTHGPSKPLAYVFLTAVFGMQNIQSPFGERIVEDFLGHQRTFFPTVPETASFIEFLRALNETVAGAEDQERLYREFVSVVLDKNKKEALSKNLFLFRAAIAFGIDVADLTHEQIQEEVRRRLPFPEGWEKTFEPLRAFESLFIYAGRIHSLSEPDRGCVLEALRSWMMEVKEGTFFENRYSQSPQLMEMEKLLPKGKWDTLISKWKEGRREVIGSKSVAAESGAIPSGRAFFEDKRGNGHFPADKMPLLCAVLDSAPGPGDESIDAVIKGGKKYTPEQRFDAICARLAQQSPMNLKYIQEALKFVPHGWELQNDLAGLVTQASAPIEELAGYTVEDTDDYWDLFLCGTEVVGSCQRVDGDQNLNKNLVGYVVDGKCRMIALKDKSGRVVARSIIKLLWDDEGKKPVLLSEKVYLNNVKFKETVEEMARTEAARLGVELVTLETAGGRTFWSYPNRSGFEYEDAGAIIQPKKPSL